MFTSISINHNKEIIAANIYYYVLDTLLSALMLFTHQCLMLIIHTHFTDEKTEKQRGWVAWPVTALVKCRAGSQTLTVWHQAVLPTIIFFHLKGVKQSIISWTNIYLAPATCQAVREVLEVQSVLCRSSILASCQPGSGLAGRAPGCRFCVSHGCGERAGGRQPRLAHLVMAMARCPPWGHSRGGSGAHPVRNGCPRRRGELWSDSAAPPSAPWTPRPAVLPVRSVGPRTPGRCWEMQAPGFIIAVARQTHEIHFSPNHPSMTTLIMMF